MISTSADYVIAYMTNHMTSYLTIYIEYPY